MRRQIPGVQAPSLWYFVMEAPANEYTWGGVEPSLSREEVVVSPSLLPGNAPNPTCSWGIWLLENHSPVLCSLCLCLGLFAGLFSSCFTNHPLLSEKLLSRFLSQKVESPDLWGFCPEGTWHLAPGSAGNTRRTVDWTCSSLGSPRLG